MSDYPKLRQDDHDKTIEWLNQHPIDASLRNIIIETANGSLNSSCTMDFWRNITNRIVVGIVHGELYRVSTEDIRLCLIGLADALDVEINPITLGGKWVFRQKSAYVEGYGPYRRLEADGQVHEHEAVYLPLKPEHIWRPANWRERLGYWLGIIR